MFSKMGKIFIGTIFATMAFFISSAQINVANSHMAATTSTSAAAAARTTAIRPGTSPSHIRSNSTTNVFPILAASIPGTVYAFYHSEGRYPESISQLDIPEDKKDNFKEWKIKSGLLIKPDLRYDDVKDLGNNFKDDYVIEMVNGWYQIEIPLVDLVETKEQSKESHTSFPEFFSMLFKVLFTIIGGFVIIFLISAIIIR